ncbi:MAG TPA: hypothetical protein VFW65_13040 [Pseudonocardiaceae bacterium]|nr:hypothetical protein [Pseudonocardiaceae bacterium]
MRFREPLAGPLVRAGRQSPDERRTRVRELAWQVGASLVVAVPAVALFAYLYRIGGADVLRIGTPFAHRPDGFRDTIGMLMAVVPVRIAATARPPSTSYT